MSLNTCIICLKVDKNLSNMKCCKQYVHKECLETWLYEYSCNKKCVHCQKDLKITYKYKILANLLNLLQKFFHKSLYFLIILIVKSIDVLVFLFFCLIIILEIAALLLFVLLPIIVYFLTSIRFYNLCHEEYNYVPLIMSHFFFLLSPFVCTITHFITMSFYLEFYCNSKIYKDSSFFNNFYIFSTASLFYFSLFIELFIFSHLSNKIIFFLNTLSLSTYMYIKYRKIIFSYDIADNFA